MTENTPKAKTAFEQIAAQYGIKKDENGDFVFDSNIGRINFDQNSRNGKGMVNSLFKASSQAFLALAAHQMAMEKQLVELAARSSLKLQVGDRLATSSEWHAIIERQRECVRIDIVNSAPKPNSPA